ncbi:MAG: LacI family DNA-binding transcriptional regulator [Janthinobacterium lividum]
MPPLVVNDECTLNCSETSFRRVVVKADGKHPVTIRDVARDAQVSVGTVSKVMNGTGQLREETQRRVRASVQRLGFVPNAFAQALNSSRSYTVAMLTDDSFGRFSLPILLGAEDALGSGTMAVFLCDTRGDTIREDHYVRALLGRRVDGFIVTGRFADARVPVRLPDGTPVVYAMTPSTDSTQTSVRLDNERGGELAVEHLLATGRRTIAHVAGNSRQASARDRAAGAARVLDSAALALSGGEVLWGGWTEEWGRQAAQILLRRAPDVDAVFAGSDQIARGVIEGIERTGRSVPRDVAVVGYDNWDVMTTGRRPELTSIDSHLPDLGRVAAGELMKLIDGAPRTEDMLIEPELVLRESSAPS